MIFVISPAKTMQQSAVQTKEQEPLFLRQANKLLEILQAYNITQLQEVYQCSEKIAQENQLRFQSTNKRFPAIYTYTGAQYKAIDILSLTKEQKQYVYEHTYIMSGMFGLLRPLDHIYLYRLPMETSLKEVSLYSYWQESIGKVLENKTIINLASLEYSKTLDRKRSNVVDVFFYINDAGKLRSPSMEVKKMRGLFLRYCAKKQTKEIEDVIAFDENGYVYQKEQSNATQLVFIKQK